jgi:hypothetical protein
VGRYDVGGPDVERDRLGSAPWAVGNEFRHVGMLSPRAEPGPVDSMGTPLAASLVTWLVAWLACRVPERAKDVAAKW